MDDLIKRLEAAAAGSRELNRQLMGIAGYTLVGPGLDTWAPPPVSDAPGAPIASVAIGTKPFSTSTDAALTLAPKGANCHGYDLSPSGVTAYWSRNNVAAGRWFVEGMHKTSVPLAFCIAALKARRSS